MTAKRANIVAMNIADRSIVVMIASLLT